MGIKCNPTCRHSRQSQRISDHSQNDQHSARIEKQPARAIHQKESQRAPAVAKCLEVWLVGLAPIGMKGDRDLSNLSAVDVRLDDHFGREFHSCTSQTQPVIEFLGEASQSTINIMDLGPEHMANKNREHRIAQPPVQERHRVWLYSAATGRKPATLY